MYFKLNLVYQTPITNYNFVDFGWCIFNKNS